MAYNMYDIKKWVFVNSQHVAFQLLFYLVLPNAITIMTYSYFLSI